jgi:hypothetical protein
MAQNNFVFVNHVTTNGFYSANRETLMEFRQVYGRQLQQIMQSGKVRASGVYADGRGAFFVLDSDSADEIFEMFAPIFDYVRIEIHPLTTVETLLEFFEMDTTAAAE